MVHRAHWLGLAGLDNVRSCVLSIQVIDVQLLARLRIHSLVELRHIRVAITPLGVVRRLAGWRLHERVCPGFVRERFGCLKTATLQVH